MPFSDSTSKPRKSWRCRMSRHPPCQQGGFCCLRSPPTPPSCLTSSPPLPLTPYLPSPPLGPSLPLPLHSCSWTRVPRRCCRCPSRSRATNPPPRSPPSPPCWSPNTPRSLQAKAIWKKLMRSTFMNPKISPPFTVNGMPQLCGFISWLFKINYFNNMSPHYKHIYLCHPPFKRLLPVSNVYKAELEASRQAPFLSSPSFRSSESSPVTEWSFPVLLSFPIPLFVDDVELDHLLPLLVLVQLLHLPPLCPLLPAIPIWNKKFKSPNNLKLDQVMFIY